MAALLVRVDPARADEAVARGAELMHMDPRVMTGFVSVDRAKLADDASLKDWIVRHEVREDAAHQMRCNETMNHLVERARWSASIRPSPKNTCSVA